MLRITLNVFKSSGNTSQTQFMRVCVCVCTLKCEKPLSRSGHFLLDRSRREQLSMRVTQMIDSPLRGGQRGHLNTGTFT